MRALLRLCWLSLLTVAISSCGIFGGEEEANPPAELVKFKATLKVRKAWSAGVGEKTEYLRLALVPASDGARVFAAGHDGRVSAFEVERGKRLWTRKTKLPLSAGPAVGGEWVVVGTSDGDVLALNADDGNERWKVSVSSEVLAAPVVAQARDLVLVRTVDGKLIALDAFTGNEIWFVQQSVPRLSVRGTGSPIIAGETVICGFDNGKVAAYALADGSLLWEALINPPSGRTEVERLADLNAAVRVAGENVYVTGYQGTVAAVDLQQGQVVWAQEVSSYDAPAVDLTQIYVAAASGELHTLARGTGQELWRDGTLLNRSLTGPAAFGNSVVVGDFDGYLHWFDAATGQLQARTRAGSHAIVAAPLVVNDLLLVLNDGGKLYAFRESGSK
ncbi:MAG: outer membrane protein assembly factor BamB [Chromatiales bacterium]|nr:MAG: outer membrane protein assembly factor BamB [Chromatiales bacterium]